MEVAAAPVEVGQEAVLFEFCNGQGVPFWDAREGFEVFDLEVLCHVTLDFHLHRERGRRAEVVASVACFFGHEPARQVAVERLLG